MDYTAARYIPKGATKIANKSGSAVAYIYTSVRNKPAAIGFIGRSGKPAMHYSYTSEQRRAEAVATFLRSAEASAVAKANRAAEKRTNLAKPHGLVIGDVLQCTWGYDQTNIDYFEVTRKVGARSVEIRKIAAQAEATGDMQGTCVPAKGRYIEEPMIKRVDENDRVRIYSFATASKVQPLRTAGMEIFPTANYSSTH